MYTGSMGAVSNREDWIVNISAVADDGSSYSFAGAAASVYVTDEDLPSNAILSGSIADGTILVSGRWPDPDMDVRSDQDERVSSRNL
jgi:hypothetical protein